MTENKRFTIEKSEGQYIIYDWEGLDDYYHLGNDTRDVKALCDLLNKQEEQIKKIEQEKESWKSFTCHDTNLKSMLSFEIEKLTETKDINAFLDFYYEYFCKINGDVNDYV